MSKCYTDKRPGTAEKLMQHGWSIMLYDGDCRLCTGVVRFAAKRAGHHLIAFSAMQSNAAKSALNRVGPSQRISDSVMILEEERVLEGCDAVLRLMDCLDGPWQRVAGALRRVPHGLRDGACNLIVNNRYRLLPKRRQCMLVGPEKPRRYVV